MPSRFEGFDVLCDQRLHSKPNFHSYVYEISNETLIRVPFIVSHGCHVSLLTPFSIDKHILRDINNQRHEVSSKCYCVDIPKTFAFYMMNILNY